MSYTDFYDDVEKMRDFKTLSKEEFLMSYNYITDEEYGLTKARVDKEGYPDLEDHYLILRGSNIDHLVKYIGKLPLDEVEDAFSSYLDTVADEDFVFGDFSEREMITTVLNSFSGVPWEFVEYKELAVF